MNRFKSSLALIICFSFLLIPINAEYYGRNVPNSSEIRENLLEKWFTNDLKYLRLQPSELYTNSIGQVFQVRLEELDNEFAVIVAPHEKLDVDLVSSKGNKTITVDVYPSDLAGSWILFRNKQDGKPLSVRYYFHKNSSIYVEFRTNNVNKVLADFVLFDMYAVHSLPVGLTIQQLYFLSFDKMVECTKNLLPWEYADIENYLYDGNLQMIGTIREKIEKKEIKTENSTDFVKWIVDGIIYPLAGNKLELEPLKTKTVSIKTGSKADTFSQNYDMYYSLDWTRNLAAAYLSVSSGKLYTFENSGCEVSVRPFAFEKTKKGTKSNPVYFDKTGYSTDALLALLYVLAINEPDKFYLGAIREIEQTSPENIYYTRAVAFFPYFDLSNNFEVAVFENGQEMTIAQFITRNPKTFVNLVRFSSSQRFFPQ